MIQILDEFALAPRITFAALDARQRRIERDLGGARVQARACVLCAALRSMARRLMMCFDR